jgi:AGCS family alanine or glycine:cation symporter
LVILTAIVILGGIKRISRTAESLVPIMVLLYFIAVSIILVSQYDKVGYYFGLIFREAFSPQFYKGDAFMGGTLGGLILLGIRRGAFSNEAGIGTAPMAHGASRTNEPIKEGLVSMLGPFIDTIVVCTLTALAILVTDIWKIDDSNGVSLTAKAFEISMPGYGSYLLMLCIAIFSISSLFSFSYYGTKCLSFLIGAHRAHWYNYFYLASIIIGAATTLDMMINLIDGFYALMAIPTMTATLIMAPRVVKAAKIYFNKIK